MYEEIKKAAQYKILYKPDHPLAVDGTVSEHRLVLYGAIGPGEHKCNWCGRVVQWQVGRRRNKFTLVVDHVNEDRGDNRRSNLVPSCNYCNTSRLNTPKVKISKDELFIVHKSGHRQRALSIPCESCGKLFLSPLSRKREALIKFCSIQCAGRAHSGEGSWWKKQPDHPPSSHEIDPTTELYVKNGKWRQRAVKRVCSQCGKDFAARDFKRMNQVNYFCVKACEVAYRRERKIERLNRKSVA